MKLLPIIDMREATRLTREGRLTEAMALLQGTSSPKAETGAAGARHDGFAHGADILDMQPPVGAGGAWTAVTRGPPRTGANTASSSASRSRGELFQNVLRPAFGKDAGATGKPAAAALTAASGARFEARTYADDLGTRAYKLYVPSGFNGEALPLVVMLHGCTQSPDDFAAGTQMNTVAEEQGFLVAYPAQPQSANASKCWNWFNAADQRRDQGEPGLIAGITRQIMREFPVQEDRVYVAGLSAGGAAAAIMGSTYPDLYAAIGVHSGLACGAASDMPSAFSAMRQGGKGAPGRSGRSRPTIVFHGDRDTTVSAINGDQVIAQSRAGAPTHAKVDHGQSSGGVGYTRTVHSDEAGRPVLEQWVLHGAGHAWSGGSSAGSYTDPRGPDASREMVRFFLQQPGAKTNCPPEDSNQ
jgi:poly(hydroxyalkanoate) depolymerase family esterase